MAGVFSKTEVKHNDRHMTCWFGNHPLQKPKLLPCQHSFCIGCIKIKVSQDGKQLICPKCQLSIPLTEGEVDQLQDDFLYPILQKTKDNHSDCDMCKFENKKIPGTFQCLDCGEVTCHQCKDAHTKTLMTRTHRLVAVKDVQSGKYKTELDTSKQHLCETHSKPNKPQFMECYCQECKCLACQICVLTQHQPQGHTCETIDEIHDEKTKAVKDLVTVLLELKQHDEELSSVLEHVQGQHKELQEKLENEVHERAALIMDIIEKVKQNNLTEIKGHFKKEEAAMQVKMNETKNRMIRTDNIVSYTQTFLEHSDKAEFLQHEDGIMKMIENPHQDEKTILETNVLELGVPQIEKVETVITEAFGEIQIKTQKLGISQEENTLREWMEEPEVLFSEHTGMGNALDLTVTENEDIVAVYESTIQIYNSEGKPKENISCRQLSDAFNVVAKGDTLYVSNRGIIRSVLVMDFNGNSRKTISLPGSHQDYHDKGLAVDNEGNVYISSRGTHTVYKCKPNETKAKVFIQEGTHPDLKGPWYMCVTHSSEVVVSNLGSNTVQVYDRHGEFLWQYTGQDDMALGTPWGVCCDKRGNIYISDLFKQRIQVVRNGEFQRHIKQTAYGIALDKEDNIVCCHDYKITKIKLWQ